MNREMPQAYRAFVRAVMTRGHEPNDIASWIDEAIGEAFPDWEKICRDEWELVTVCQVCGAWAARLCGHAAMGLPKVPRSQFRPNPERPPEIGMCDACRRLVPVSDMDLVLPYMLCPECAAERRAYRDMREKAGL